MSAIVLRSDFLGSLIDSLLYVLLLLGLAPLLQGWIKKVKAGWQMRSGPGVLQPYRDLYKLWSKEEIISEHASSIFMVTPAIVLASTLLAALVVPSPWGWVPLDVYGSVFWLVAALGIGRFFLTLAGLDPAGAFGGMGSSRELFVAVLVEPGLLLALMVLAIMSNTTSLLGITQQMQGISLFEPPRILALLAIGFMVIAEIGRIPVDNPDTHLELTMIHEGMLLEYSGRSLAFLNWAEQLKQFLLLNLLALQLFPGSETLSGSGLTRLLFHGAMVLLLGALFATVESANVKVRLFRIPNFLAAGAASGALALVTLWLMRGGL